MIRKAFKYQLYPTEEQKGKFAKHFGRPFRPMRRVGSSMRAEHLPKSYSDHFVVKMASNPT